MSPPNDRRVPRYQEPAPHEVLAKLKATIEAGHQQMAKIEESALSGHYADRAQAQRIIGRQDEQDAIKHPYPHPEIGKATLGIASIAGGISPGPQHGFNGPKKPEFTPPMHRVLQAEARVKECRGHLEAVVERLVGPIPEQAAETALEPNPWGGAAGEIANAAASIRIECERMEFLLRALDELVP